MWLVLLVALKGVFHGPAVEAYKLPSGDSGSARSVIAPRLTASKAHASPARLAASEAHASPGVYGELYREQVQKLGQQPQVTLRGGSYEDHTFTQLVTLTPTVTSTVTNTHTLRIPSTSDVWITSLKTEILPVTQLLTSWAYRPALPETVTSFVRVTQTKFVPSTVTVETFPTKTLVSIYTAFVTSTTEVDYWQPITHYSTQYEHVTRPVLESQTLLQRLFTTTTLVDYRDVTTTRRFQEW